MDMNKIIEFAYELLNETDIAKHYNVCNKYISDLLNIDMITERDYDTSASIIIMCVNKIMNEKLGSIVEEEKYEMLINDCAREELSNIESFINSELILINDEENNMFRSYVLYICKSIFGAFLSHDKKRTSDSYQAYQNRYLIQLYRDISKIIPVSNSDTESTILMGFTEKYHIEIPYYYCYVFEFQKCCKPYLLLSDKNNIKERMKNYSIGASTIINAIRLDNPLIRFNIKLKRESRYITEIGDTVHVYLRKYLPSLIEQESNIIKNNMELYRMFPCVPFLIDKYKYETTLMKDRINMFQTTIIENLNRELEYEKNINNEKQKNIDFKEKVLDRHAHDWKHIVYPSIVSEVAAELTANKDYVNAGKLFSAYNSEQMLKLDLDLLKFEFKSEDEKLNTFKKSVELNEYSLYPVVEDVMYDALEIVLFKLIMVDDIEEIQNIKSEVYDIPILKEKFINEVIVNIGKEGGDSYTKKEVIKKWFEENFYNIRVQHNSSVWSDGLHFMNEEQTVAYTQIYKMFINLFTNLLNYGVKNQNGYVDIEFDEEMVHGVRYLTIKMRNPIDRDTAFYKSSGNGVENIRETVRVLNLAQEGKTDIEDIHVDDEEYAIKVFWSADIFE